MMNTDHSLPATGTGSVLQSLQFVYCRLRIVASSFAVTAVCLLQTQDRSLISADSGPKFIVPTFFIAMAVSQDGQGDC